MCAVVCVRARVCENENVNVKERRRGKEWTKEGKGVERCK